MKNHKKNSQERFSFSSNQQKMYIILSLCAFFLLVFGIWLTSFSTSNSLQNSLDEDSIFEENASEKEKFSSSHFEKNTLKNGLKKEIQKALEKFENRNRFLDNIHLLLAQKDKKLMALLKLKVLNTRFQQNLFQMDLTGRFDVNNRPETVPSHRIMMRKIMDMIVKSNPPSASDFFLTLISSKIFYKPSSSRIYGLHLHALVCLSKVKTKSRRALVVLRRILQSSPSHQYGQAEKEWALVALRSLNTRESIEEIQNFILDESHETEETFLAIRTFIQTNKKEDIQLLKRIAKLANKEKIRTFTYRALAGIPGRYDEFGIRITANRKKATLQILQNIQEYFEKQIKEEKQTKIRSLLRRFIRRMTLLIDQKRFRKN